MTAPIMLRAAGRHEPKLNARTGVVECHSGGYVVYAESNESPSQDDLQLPLVPVGFVRKHLEVNVSFDGRVVTWNVWDEEVKK